MGKVAISPMDPESFDEIMRTVQKSIDAIVESPAFKVNMAIAKSVNETMKRNQAMFDSMIANMPKITLPSSTLYFPTLPPTNITPRPKNKLVSGLDLVDTGTMSTAKQKTQRVKKDFGLYFIAGYSVQFRRRTLKGFSLETQPGQLLTMLLEADGHFVSDAKLLRTFKKVIINDIGHIRRNLKNTLKNNGLQITIERRKKTKGYVLVDIKEIATKTD
jgi:hypothetical protein